MENQASITSLMSAFVRAYHQKKCRRPVVDDSVAHLLLTDDEYERIKGYILAGADFFVPGRKDSFSNDDAMLEHIIHTQLAPTVLARARYNEQCLRTSIMTGTTQYVILGAGMDTFAWRETELMHDLNVFEVDHPLTQQDKLARLDRAGLTPPERLRFVPADLGCDDLCSLLRKSGFDTRKKTFFSWLGVSYYLTIAQISALLEQISSFAAEGSTLLFDCADADLFSASEQRVQNMLSMAAAGGEPMHFCTDESALTELLAQHHFLIYELLSPSDIQCCCLDDADGDMTAFEHIFFVQAVLSGTQFINTKEKILIAALRLFARYGYDAVSVQDIAAQLGITKGALYKHYGSKRDVFDSIVMRMEQLDRQRAQEYGMPEDDPTHGGEAYGKTSLSQLKSYSEAQFRLWTEDEFCACFRRLLTLEQYRSTEASARYQQYLCAGPLRYVEDIFRSAGLRDPRRQALEFFAPIYALYGVYDGATNDAERQQTLLLLRDHLSVFDDGQIHA